MSTSADYGTDVKQKVKPPSLWKVVMLNDNKTPFDFVVALLMLLFKHPEEIARNLASTIHNNGSAVVGIYSFEIAEEKAFTGQRISREQGFPLKIKLEEDK